MSHMRPPSPGPVCPVSSPRMASPGRSRRTSATIARSASTSALVAKSPPPFSTRWRAEPKRWRTTAAPASAAARATSTSRMRDTPRLDLGGGAGEEVTAPARELGARVGLPLHLLDHDEAGGPQRVNDISGKIKAKVEVHRLAEELIHVHHVTTYVEGDEYEPARHQRPPQLGHDGGELVRREVDDRIEGDRADETGIGQAQLPHVAYPELLLGIEPPCLFDHVRRQVDADHAHALVMKVSRDMAGTAAEVGHEAATAHLFGEPIEKMAVERLAGELRGEIGGVGAGHGIVAVTNAHGHRLTTQRARGDAELASGSRHSPEARRRGNAPRRGAARSEAAAWRRWARGPSMSRGQAGCRPGTGRRSRTWDAGRWRRDRSRPRAGAPRSGWSPT